MAKKMKAGDAAKPKRISAEDYKSVAKRVDHAKSNQQEYQGLYGQEVKSAVERHNLNRAAFGFATRLRKMEEAKRADVIRSLIWYLHCDGAFAQIDAFDDLSSDLEDILDVIRSNDNSSKAADPNTVAALAGSPSLN